MNSVTYLKNHFVEQILVLKKLVEGILTQQLGMSKKPTVLTLRSKLYTIHTQEKNRRPKSAI